MGSSSSKPSTPASPATGIQGTSQQQQQQEPTSPDKLREGPCADTFELLEKCRHERGLRKDPFGECVSETDLLIICVQKNPAYFHTQK
jgi:hypothetical protein